MNVGQRSLPIPGFATTSSTGVRVAEDKRVFEIEPTSASIAHATGALSTWDTALAIASTAIGGGMLALPNAFRQGGWAIIIVLFVAGAVMTYTLSIVGSLMENANAEADRLGFDVGNRDWATIGTVAFGQTGRLIYAIVQNVQLYGSMIAFTMLGSTCLHDMLDCTNMTLLTIVFGAIMSALMFIDLSRIAVLSALGNLSVLLMVVSLVMTSAQVWYSGETAQYKDVDLKQIPAAGGSIIMMLTAHGEAPFLYQNMANPAEWHSAVVMGMSMVVFWSLLIGAIGYAGFGEATQDSFSDNIGRDLSLKQLPGYVNTCLARMSLALMAGKILATQPVVGLPIVMFVKEQACLSTTATGFLKLFVALSSTLLCLFLSDEMTPFIDWLGSVVENGSALLLPVLAHWKLQKRHLPLALELIYLFLALAAISYMLGASVSIL